MAADDAGVETVLLAAPTTPDARLVAICERSHGFVYGVGLMGVTGERSRARHVGRDDGPSGSRRPPTSRCSSASACPRPQQAAEAAADADGVIVGSALIRRLLEGAGPDGAADFVAELRAGLDAG